MVLTSGLGASSLAAFGSISLPPSSTCWTRARVWGEIEDVEFELVLVVTAHGGVGAAGAAGELLEVSEVVVVDEPPSRASATDASMSAVLGADAAPVAEPGTMPAFESYQDVRNERSSVPIAIPAKTFSHLTFTIPAAPLPIG